MFHFRVEKFSPTGPARRFAPRHHMQAYRKALALRMRRLFATSAWMSREIPAEIAFLSDYGVPEPVLSYAATLARRQQTDALDVLLSEGLVEEDVYYRALAQHIGAPFLTQFEIDAGAEHEFATKRGYARLGSNPEGLEWLFAPEGATLRRLLGLAKNGRLRKIFGVTTRRRFLEAIEWERLHRAALAAPYTVERKFPEICARRALLGPSLLWAIVLNAVALTLLFAPNPMLALASALPLSGLFFLSVFLRLFACAASHEAVTSTPRLGDAELPRYTLVVPLYREARVASQLARAIDKLDYPRAKLDVIFVVEREDRETAAALREHAPRAPHRILAAPDGEPKTKPRALNIAKDFAEGALLAVYDAEDLPEPGQLREAASLFATLPSQVACLQAMLAIDNGDRNLLTAHFALDYAALFEVFNRGLGEMETPIFLGGTSNHFRFEALEAVGFWDAYNVTEDADLGLRLARAGYLVKTFRSRTFEEAPVTLKALFFQRTRWLKGWMQTALAHCRAPRGLFDDLGPRRTLAALGMFTGGFAAPLLGPWLALVFLYRAVFGNLLAPQTWSELVLSTLWCSLTLFGAVAVIWPLLLGMRRAELTRLWPALLATPLWHLMLSAAAWRALYELWDKPHHWRKTDHGGVWRREAPALRRTANS